jgi:hypothetical protein
MRLLQGELCRLRILGIFAIQAQTARLEDRQVMNECELLDRAWG